MKTVVVLRHDLTINVDELIDLVKQRKGSLHAQKSIDVVDSIPMSTLAHPDNKPLRARFWIGG